MTEHKSTTSETPRQGNTVADWSEDEIIIQWAMGDDADDMPTCPGVYALFLVEHDRARPQLVYVGKTVNLRRRIGEHNATVPFNFVSYEVMPADAISDFEKQVIFDTKPPLNRLVPMVRPELVTR